MTDDSIPYVHDGKEVRLTGRYAKSADPKMKGNDSIVVEVHPWNSPPEDKMYCKWVPLKSLMIVMDDKKTNFEIEDDDDETE